VAGLLSHLDLGERIHHKPNQLSGGQKQRVAFARAIINHPRLILADEPTAALDKVSSVIVVDLLKNLAQHGSTILVVTHDNRIMDKGDRVVTMKDGRIVSNILVDETVRICFFLQKVSLFSGLTPSHLVEVAAKVRKEIRQAGESIIRQGEVGHKFYLVKDGKVDVLREEGGASVVQATLGAGQFFGETALIEDQPRNATVTAKERVELYTLEKEDFLRAHGAFESMRDELLKVFAQRLPGP
jgi:putative ABC transport system ATP-binding protein